MRWWLLEELKRSFPDELYKHSHDYCRFSCRAGYVALHFRNSSLTVQTKSNVVDNDEDNIT